MTIKKKREIRKEVFKLGFHELRKLIEDETAKIEEVNADGFHVIIGIAGKKKHVGQCMKIHESAYRIKCAASRLESMMFMNATEYRRQWIDDIMKMTSLEEASE